MTLPGRGLGYLQDVRLADELRFGADVGRAAGALVPVGAASLAAYRPPIIYQGRQPVCVGMALGKALWQAQAIAGRLDPVVPSPSWIYWAALKEEGVADAPGARRKLQNRGCHPRLAVRATERLGFVPWAAWPYDEDENPLRPKGVGVDVRAYGQRGLRAYRIEAYGPERLAQTADALRLGYPVIVGMQVDQGFAEHRGEAPYARIDPARLLGGHMMVVLTVALDRVVLLNHWQDHGYDGDLVAVTPDVFGGPAVTDLYAISALPPTAGGCDT